MKEIKNHILNIGMEIICMIGQCQKYSQKMTSNGLIKSLWLSIKSYNTESDKGYFVEIDIYYPENLHNLHNELSFLLEKKWKLKKLKNF